MRPTNRRALAYLELALDALRPLGRRRAAAEKIEDLVGEFAKADPRRALKVARTIPKAHEESRDLAIRWAAEALAADDLAAGLALLEEIRDPKQRSYALGQMILDARHADPGAALDLTGRLPPDEREWLRALLVGPLFVRDEKRAREEVRRIRNPLFRVQAISSIWSALREAGDQGQAGEWLRKLVDGIRRLPAKWQAQEIWDVLETGDCAEVLEILDACDPLEYWPQPYLESEYLADFRRLLRYDRDRTLAAVERVVGEDADAAMGIAAVALWSRSPHRASAYFDRIRNPDIADDVRVTIVREIAGRRPAEAARILRDRPPAHEAMDRLWRAHDWLAIGTDEAVAEALATARGIRHSGARARALAGSAGTLWTTRLRLARSLLREAEAIVPSLRTRRARDRVREDLVKALTDWPPPIAANGIERAEEWAAKAESPLSRATCYVTLGESLLPVVRG